jgi:hypothetical protein
MWLTPWGHMSAQGFSAAGRELRDEGSLGRRAEFGPGGVCLFSFFSFCCLISDSFFKFKLLIRFYFEFQIPT